EKAGLNAGDGVGADHAIRFANIHTRKPGGALKESLSGDPQAGSNDAANELTLARDHVEAGGGAEVNDHTRTAELFEAGHTVHNAVGPNLSGIVVLHWHSRLDSGLDKERSDAEVAFADFAQDGIDRRNYRRDDDVLYAADLDGIGSKQVAEE